MTTIEKDTMSKEETSEVMLWEAKNNPKKSDSKIKLVLSCLFMSLIIP